MEEAVKIVLHYSKGLQQTPSGHWAYNGHVLYNFISLRAIKGAEMRAEAEKFAAAYVSDLGKQVIHSREEAERISKGGTDLLSTRLVSMEIDIYRQEVLECIKPGLSLEPNQLCALTSFAHSIGMPAFSHSGTLKAINVDNDFCKAADLMCQWNKINTMGLPYHQIKKVSNRKLISISDILTARRKSEKELFLTGKLLLV